MEAYPSLTTQLKHAKHQVTIKEDLDEPDKPQVPGEEEAFDPGEDWTTFESKGTEEHWEHVNTIIVVE